MSDTTGHEGTQDVDGDTKELAPTKDTRIGAPDGPKPGRQKGSKNKSTLLREALTNNFEEALEKRFKKVIEVVLDQAEDGCRQSQKLLLDRVVPTVHATPDKDGKSKFSGGIHITIGSMDSGQQVAIGQDIEDVEYTEID